MADSEPTSPVDATPAGTPTGAKTPTVAELRAEAKSKGVHGYSTMKKAELIAALAEAHPATPAPATTESRTPATPAPTTSGEPAPASAAAEVPAPETDVVAQADAARETSRPRRATPTPLPGDRVTPGMVAAFLGALAAVFLLLRRRRRRRSANTD